VLAFFLFFNLNDVNISIKGLAKTLISKGNTKTKENSAVGKGTRKP